MTPKERITAALKNQVPDRVPVTLSLSEMVPVKYFGDDYISFFWKDKIPLWKARVETEYNRFGADSFMHLSPGHSPYDPPLEISNIKESSEKVTYTQTIHTAQGDLSADLFIGRRSPISFLSHYVKDPESEQGRILDLLKHPDSKDLKEMTAAYVEIGPRAHMGLWIPMPIDWWAQMRGTQTMIMDLLDYPELMALFFQAYTEYAISLTDYVLINTTIDSIGLGGSSTSMSVISPDLHKKYSLAFGQAISQVAHKYEVPVQYHMCGKSRKALPITAEMGVDGFDALECPPTGDIDLAEVKKVFGDKVSLRGNVNSITKMLNGQTADVEKEVIRCLNAAKDGGGFILGVGDQTPYATSEENLFCFVETGKKYGAYGS